MVAKRGTNAKRTGGKRRAEGDSCSISRDSRGWKSTDLSARMSVGFRLRLSQICPAAQRRYYSHMLNTFTAVFEMDGDGWIAYVEELPGANTHGDTLDEARENLKDAVTMVLEANRELAERQIGGKSLVREKLVVTAP